MPLVWDADTGYYEWEDQPLGYTGAPIDVGRKDLAGTLMGQAGAPTQFMSAAERFLPRYEESPWSGRAIQRQYQPMLGSYLLADPFATGEPMDFQTFVHSNLGEDPNVGMQTTGTGAEGDPEILAPGWAANVGGTDLTANWGNLIRAVQSQGDFATRAPQAAWDPYLSLIQDENLNFIPENIRALESLATYRPGVGSIYGRIRDAALARAKRGWETANPLGSQADWLGYLGSGFTRGGPGGPAPLLRAGWQVPNIG